MTAGIIILLIALIIIGWVAVALPKSGVARVGGKIMQQPMATPFQKKRHRHSVLKVLKFISIVMGLIGILLIGFDTSFWVAIIAAVAFLCVAFLFIPKIIGTKIRDF